MSVIVETFNFEGDVADLESLKANVKSLLSQKPGVQFEVIVVVEGKNRELLAQVKAIRGVRVLPGRWGYIAMKNDGLKAANYGLIGFVDSDVVVNENWIQEAVKALRSEEAVTGRTYYETDRLPAKAASLMLFGFAQLKEPRYTDLVVGNNMAFRRKLLEEFPLAETPARGGLRRFACKLLAAGKRIWLNPRMVARHKYTHDTLFFKMFTDSLDYVRSIQQAPHLPTVPFPSFWPVSLPLIAAKNFLKDVKNLLMNGRTMEVPLYAYPAMVAVFAAARTLFFAGLVVAVINPGCIERKYGVY